jgi:hypothetical protein
VKSWTSRNRLGLILLPIALILALAGSSSRVHEYWWARGFHHAEQANDKGVVHFVDKYDDGYQRYPIRGNVSLVSVKKVGPTVVNKYSGQPEVYTKPTGSTLWRVKLHFDVDPSIVMTGCQVAIKDTAGNLYRSDTVLLDLPGATKIYLCAPDDTPGPQTKVGSTAPPAVEDGQDPRPRRYDSELFVLTSDHAKPKSVLVWFFLPKYAELPIR